MNAVSTIPANRPVIARLAYRSHHGTPRYLVGWKAVADPVFSPMHGEPVPLKALDGWEELPAELAKYWRPKG